MRCRLDAHREGLTTVRSSRSTVEPLVIETITHYMKLIKKLSFLDALLYQTNIS